MKNHVFSTSISIIFIFSSMLSEASPVALRHVRVIDGNSEVPKENMVILIDQEKIIDVFPENQKPLPPETKEIELSGKTVMPGLISDHSHLGLTNGTASGSENYNRANIERQLKQYQQFGVTTVNSLGMNGALFQEIRSEAHAGKGIGTDVFGADRGIGVPEGAPPVTIGVNQLYRPATPDEAREAVRDMANRHPDMIKVWVDDFNHTLKNKMKPEIYTAIIDEAHKNHIRVAAHIHYLDDAKKLVAAGVDILAHGIRDQVVDNTLISMMKEKGTWYIPTLDLDESFYIYASNQGLRENAFFQKALQPALAEQFNDAAWRDKTLSNPEKVALWKENLRINQENLKRLSEAGINIGFGTDSGATPLRIPGYAEHRELQLIVQSGLKPVQAINMATSQAAALLKLDDRGVISPGKRADLLVLNGNPAYDITQSENIYAIWNRGRLVYNLKDD